MDGFFKLRGHPMFLLSYYPSCRDMVKVSKHQGGQQVFICS
jgi:hypothetical protein